MPIKCLLAGLLLMSLVVSQQINADGGWAGYINDKSLSEGLYGYLWSVSNSKPRSKLRLVCHSDGVFTLYIDEEIITDPASVVTITVDRLSTDSLVAKRVGDSYGFSNQDPEFWRLIAQMSAGAILRINSGVFGVHRYSLSGFTNTFLSHCGWSGEAEQFQQYLHHYR